MSTLLSLLIWVSFVATRQKVCIIGVKCKHLKASHCPHLLNKTAFKRKFAVMLMLKFDGSSFRKNKKGIKKSAKIKSMMFL